MNVFEALVRDIDSALASFVTDFSSNLISAISPLVQIGCVLYFIWVGIAYIKGLTNDTLTDIGWHIFKVSVIIAIGLGVGTYQQYIVTPIINMPDQLINTLIGGSGATGSALVTLVDKVITDSTQLAQDYMSLAEFSVTGGVNLTPVFCAILVMIGSVLCVAVGCFWYLATKILLTLMLALGALFIVSLIWSKTEGFFSSWLNAVVMLILVNLMVTAIFSVFVNIFSTMLNKGGNQVGQASGAEDITIGIAFSLGITGFLICATLLLIPPIASMLANSGFGFNGMAGASASLGKGTSNTGKGAVKAGQAGVKAGKAVANHFKK